MESAIIFLANITPTYTTRIWYRFSRLARKKPATACECRLRMVFCDYFMQVNDRMQFFRISLKIVGYTLKLSARNDICLVWFRFCIYPYREDDTLTIQT